MAFTPFMPAVPSTHRSAAMFTPAIPTDTTPTPTKTPAKAALLLRYLAHVQETGLCAFPPLEAHLQRYAREARQRQALEEAQIRAALAEASRPALTDAPRSDEEVASADPVAAAQDLESEPTPGASQEETGSSALALPSGGSGIVPVAEQGLVVQPTIVEPGCSPLQGNSESCELTTIPRLPSEPLPLISRSSAAASRRRLAVLPGGRAPSRLFSKAGVVAEAGNEEPTSAAPAPAAPVPAASALVAMPAAAEAPAARAIAPAVWDPRLELLLRFQDNAQHGSHCQPPALQQRLTALVEARELDRGNSRDAQERLRQRSHALLQRIRTGLGLTEIQPASPESSLGHLHRLGQLQAQLEDGFRSYGLRLDRPLQRMLARQLRRAADQERRLQRRLGRGHCTPALQAELEVLADILETVLDQWLPLAPTASDSREATPPTTVASQGVGSSSAIEHSAAPEPQIQRPEPANAIRPAAIVPLCREEA